MYMASAILTVKQHFVFACTTEEGDLIHLTCIDTKKCIFVLFVQNTFNFLLRFVK